MTTERWRQWRGLHTGERILLVQAAILLPLFALALRVVGFRRLVVGLARTPLRDGGASGAPITTTTARLVDSAARHAVYRQTTCLTRSLVLWWLLRRQGVDSELRIGVRQAGGRIEAHAWLEQAGLVLNDFPQVIEAFAPFTERDLMVALPALKRATVTE